MVIDPVAFQLLEYTEPAAWNALVKLHPHGHVLQSWGWGDLKGAFGWRPLRVAVENTAGPLAAAQVLFKRVAGLAVAYIPRGPLFSGDQIADTLLLQALRRIARQRRAAFLRLEPNVLETDPQANALHSLLQTQGFQDADPLQPRTSIHLDLAPAPVKLLQACSKGHRADVRRAERAGVQVRIGSTTADLAAFYRIMEATAARAHFGIHSEQYYARAFALMSEPWYRNGNSGDSAAHLLLAEQQDEVIAAFLIFGWGTEGQYMYSGATEAGLRSGANHLLQWHAIQWVQAQGCDRYDLWGIPDAIGELESAGDDQQSAREEAVKVHPLYGAYRFKKGWGGRIVRYLPAYDQVYFHPAYWLWKRRGGSA